MNRYPALLIAAMLTIPGAYASGGSESATASNPKWRTECGSCHLSFPPKLLPAASWRALMGSLDKHFGTDASLDAATSGNILAFLEKNASRGQPETTGKPQLRITQTRWFQSEHDEVPARLWKDPRVKTPANCAACHAGSENGSFNEHNIHLPK